MCHATHFNFENKRIVRLITLSEAKLNYNKSVYAPVRSLKLIINCFHICPNNPTRLGPAEKRFNLLIRIKWCEKFHFTSFILFT